MLNDLISSTQTIRFAYATPWRPLLGSLLVMNPCNGMVSPPVPKTPGNHGRYRHIHLGAYVLAHHVSFPIRLMRIAHSHDVLDSSLHTPDYHGLCTVYDHSPSHPMVALRYHDYSLEHVV